MKWSGLIPYFFVLSVAYAQEPIDRVADIELSGAQVVAVFQEIQGDKADQPELDADQSKLDIDSRLLNIFCPRPIATGAFGRTSLEISEDAAAGLLEASNISTAVTQISINLGPPDQNGPPMFILFDADRDGAFPGSLEWSLGERDFLRSRVLSDLGVRTFTDALQNISDLNAYMIVSTRNFPQGEIRGLLGASEPGARAVVECVGAAQCKLFIESSQAANCVTFDCVSRRGVPVCWCCCAAP